jgi:hypothetical protein
VQQTPSRSFAKVIKKRDRCFAQPGLFIGQTPHVVHWPSEQVIPRQFEQKDQLLVALLNRLHNEYVRLSWDTLHRLACCREDAALRKVDNRRRISTEYKLEEALQSVWRHIARALVLARYKASKVVLLPWQPLVGLVAHRMHGNWALHSLHRVVLAL